MPTIRRYEPLIAAAILLSACSRGEQPADARADRAAKPRGIEVVGAGATLYLSEQVVSPGAIVGTISLIGDPPGDTTVVIWRDQRVCGNSLRQITIDASGGRLGGAIVWIADIARGKAPGLSRRYEIVAERCTFSPMVQPALAGGVVNVRNDDAIVSNHALLDLRTFDTVMTLQFTDAGEVVPLDRVVRSPALLQLQSSTHPWMRTWIAAFGHPYFDVSTRAGAFHLDSVPPGSYAVRAWHPRLGLTSATVTVRSGATDTLSLEFRADSIVAAAP